MTDYRSLPLVGAMAIQLLSGTFTALAAEAENGARTGFAHPVSTAHRRFIDQTGKIYLLKTMASWAMSQNCSDAEITQALEGLKALRFNAVTVSPFGVHMNDSFGDRYKNKAGQRFFTAEPYASSLGPAWSSMDRVMREATRLEMTVVFSLFMSPGNTGTALDLIAAGTTNAYDFGKAVATRYASYSNIVWHVMGDFKWRYNEGPAAGLDAIFHGIRDVEGSSHRLIIAEPANGSTSFDQFISAEGPAGYKWFKQSADTIYHYGSSSVAQFDKVYNWPAAAMYPIVDIEPPYVNAPHYKDQQNQELRERNYATFIRGGAGINFGHEKWWPHGVTGLFDGGPGWLNVLSEAPQFDAKYAWTILDAYVTDPAWMPDAGTFLKSGLGSGDDQAASGYSSGAALVYFPTSRPVTIDTTKIARGSNVRLRWYDPTSGDSTIIAESEPKASDRSVTYPSKRHADGFNDWVLVAEGH
ncbi:DUF4038 domain-containing protein [Bradyrhizobium zhanjiangense]|uniref:DUF4038 domain-containing protein n=1 Tax=Bradyrhizobium zhanjiangense TaxID=1325107 RepID=A0A4Q0QAE7_9BRAD|nr:DUF4038 domain-containing protein [Bradyrhizobium zhanjiangense]RXG86147.1 DUF4038 domain-containing protein [Bradyrhizobium zhanjiangense]